MVCRFHAHHYRRKLTNMTLEAVELSVAGDIQFGQRLSPRLPKFLLLHFNFSRNQ
jgi:hypothetical protein